MMDVISKLQLNVNGIYITTKDHKWLPMGAMVQFLDFGPEDTGALVEAEVDHPATDWCRLVLAEEDLLQMGLKPHPDYN